MSSLLALSQEKPQAPVLMEIPHSIPMNTHLPVPANPSLRSLFLVGDSEISSGPGGTSAAGEGWGQPLSAFFDPSKINVVNRAITSSSSRAYIAEGYWADTLALVKSGDIVLIQFGQNEAARATTGPPTTVPPTTVLSPAAQASAVQLPSSEPAADLPIESSLPGTADTFREIAVPGTDQHGVIHTYGWYLRQLVVDTIARGATPILCSPTPHRDWQAGHIRQSADTYAGWAQAIAIQQRMPFLDLNRILATRYDTLGEAAAAPLFNTIGNNTSPAGAQATAQLIVGALKGLVPDPLAGYFSEAANPIAAIAPPTQPAATQPAPSLQPAL